MIRTFYRIVTNDPPEESDFYSYERLGISVARPSAEPIRRQQDISVYSTIERAVRRARQYPHLGSFIAIMEIDDERILVDQTGRNPAHYTILANPIALLRAVVDTIRVWNLCCRRAEG
jgi:hypothetical protein